MSSLYPDLNSKYPLPVNSQPFSYTNPSPFSKPTQVKTETTILEYESRPDFKIRMCDCSFKSLFTTILCYPFVWSKIAGRASFCSCGQFSSRSIWMLILCLIVYSNFLLIIGYIILLTTNFNNLQHPFGVAMILTELASASATSVPIFGAKRQKHQLTLDIIQNFC